MCIGNTCRSQMAEGLARAYGEGYVEVKSAGTHALGEVNRGSIDSMADIGIDISGQTSDQFDEGLTEWADVVVTLGCCKADDLCPVGFVGRKIDWPVDDPYGAPSDMMDRVRDDIAERLKGLFMELNLSEGGL
jgi:arsenate reductase